MNAFKSIKTIVCSFALAVAAYATVGVATTTTGMSQAHAGSSSFSKQLKKNHERIMKAEQRRITNTTNRFIRDTHKTAVAGVIGVASGGILLSRSDRKRLEKIQAQRQTQQYNQYYHQQAQQQQYYQNTQNKYQSYYLQ